VIPVKELQIEGSLMEEFGSAALPNRKRRNKSETYYSRGVRPKSPSQGLISVSPKEQSMMIKRERGLKTLCLSQRPMKKLNSRLNES